MNTLQQSPACGQEQLRAQSADTDAAQSAAAVSRFVRAVARAELADLTARVQAWATHFRGTPARTVGLHLTPRASVVARLPKAVVVFLPDETKAGIPNDPVAAALAFAPNGLRVTPTAVSVHWADGYRVRVPTGATVNLVTYGRGRYADEAAYPPDWPGDATGIEVEVSDSLQNLAICQRGAPAASARVETAGGLSIRLRLCEMEFRGWGACPQAGETDVAHAAGWADNVCAGTATPTRLVLRWGDGHEWATKVVSWDEYKAGVKRKTPPKG